MDPPWRMKPAQRRIPAAIYEVSRKEFLRLLTYFYEPSNSSITSPIVVAPKATSPFVRICGDYRQINKLLKIFNFPIPDVLKELHKAANARSSLTLTWQTRSTTFGYILQRQKFLVSKRLSVSFNPSSYPRVWHRPLAY